MTGGPFSLETWQVTLLGSAPRSDLDVVGMPVPTLFQNRDQLGETTMSSRPSAAPSRECSLPFLRPEIADGGRRSLLFHQEGAENIAKAVEESSMIIAHREHALLIESHSDVKPSVAVPGPHPRFKA